jgi:alanine racemase
MVKADAYGLGLSRAVAAMGPVDPWGYGVATVEEAAALRTLGVEAPVLVFSPLPPGSYDTVVELAAVPCISDIGAIGRFRSAAHRAATPAEFHLEVDTGMGRAGFDWRRAAEWGASVAEHCDGIRPTGVFTHFHSADQGADSVQSQWRRLEDALAALPWPRDSLMVHVCNSAAALRLPGLGADGVRPGIFLYGGVAGRGLPPPEPAATVRSRVVLVKEAPPGSTLGYGATHQARGWERWATLAIGYGDGLPRSLGNRGHALVGGTRAPIIGRISMDMTVVDITDLADVEVGDVATLVGSDGTETISLEEVAELAGTINYEILTGLTQRLPRIWLDDGRD